MAVNHGENVQYPNCRVLVVDDNAVSSKVACKTLAAMGITVDEAGGGERAVALARERRYDLIFMDHLMPGMDGIQAAEAILAECGPSAAPVMIAMTGNEAEGAREMYLSHGFRDFIQKPMNRDRVEELLARWAPESGKRREQESPKAPPSARELIKLFMSGVDVIGAANRQGGVDAYLKLLDVFYAEGRVKAGTLQELLDRGDLEGYAIEVHGLQSAAASIGAKDLSALALRQEEAGGRGDLETVRAQSPSLLECYQKTLSEIRRVLTAQGYGRFAGR